MALRGQDVNIPARVLGLIVPGELPNPRISPMCRDRIRPGRENRGVEARIWSGLRINFSHCSGSGGSTDILSESNRISSPQSGFELDMRK